MTYGRVILKRAAARTKNLILARTDMLADRPNYITQNTVILGLCIIGTILLEQRELLFPSE